jgi:hypothetical protein
MELENKTEISTTQKPEQTARRPGHRWKDDIKNTVACIAVAIKRS